MKHITPTILIALTMTLFPGRAEGMLIEFTFGGQLSEFLGTPTPPWESGGIGSEFLVTYVFDTETPDLENNTFFARYAVEWLSVSIDGVSQTTSSAEIVLDLFDPSLQEYSVNYGGIPDGFGGSFELFGFFVLDSDALPTDINLDEWFFPFFFVNTVSSQSSGFITTFSSRIVPLPSIFFPAGMLGILFLHGRRRF